MMMFKPFALVAACVLGLAFMVTPVAGECAWTCDDPNPTRRLSDAEALLFPDSPMGLSDADDALLFPAGKYDEEARERLAQRRAQEECYCDRLSRLSTQDECCGGCGKGKGKGKGDDRRRLIKGAPKGAKSSSTKSSRQAQNP